ncbi:MAG: hypothetical protein KJO77_01400 [Bacteroidia bacterium]|nr:hypothetical protein [Bacteroidia bacterium]
MIKSTRLVFLFVLVTSAFSYAQSNSFFNADLLGQWEGKGNLFGAEASFSMHWEEVLDQKFTKLKFRNQFKDRSGVDRVMKATGYYDVKNNKGQWFDSRGVMLPLVLELENNKLTVFWGDDSSTEKGKTIYTMIGKEKINVEDFYFREGSYHAFGSAEYSKSKDQ